MSLAALANDDILRTDRMKIDYSPVIESSLSDVYTRLAPADVQAVRNAVRPVAATSPIQKSSGSDALDGLVKYIPTESITLYIAATAALKSLSAIFPMVTPYTLYWGFTVLTPALFVLIYIGKRRSQRLAAWPERLIEWPWWKTIASTIAFAVWALAVPPLVDSDAGKIISAFGALLVSTFLSVVGQAVEPVNP
jgi:uncharacterized membrane protein (DUF441 family)